MFAMFILTGPLYGGGGDIGDGQRGFACCGWLWGRKVGRKDDGKLRLFEARHPLIVEYSTWPECLGGCTRVGSFVCEECESETEALTEGLVPRLREEAHIWIKSYRGG